MTLFPGLGDPKPHDPVGAVKPLIKWVGGKTRVLPELVRRMPRAWRTYYEPFFGGGALYWHVEPPRAVLGDANGDLMNMYRQVRDSPGGLADEVARLATLHSKDFYDNVRTLWNAGEAITGGPPTPRNRAAMFLYLNKTCFNGLWRVNAAGEFNVPFNKSLKPKFPSVLDLRVASEILLSANAALPSGPYQDTLLDASHGDFMYIDPPYIPLSDTSSFVAYDKGGFDDAAQVELAANARVWMSRGVQVMLSNSDTPRTRELYGDHDWRVDAVQVNRCIGADGAKRAPVGEVIITSRNYEHRGG